MSHPSKIDFLQKAKQNKFRTYLYFISTLDRDINTSRVKARVAKGGHNVSDDKIESRYYRSMELLQKAFVIADRAFIIDNSRLNEHKVLARKNKDKIHILEDEIPEWIDEYLLTKLNLE